MSTMNPYLKEYKKNQIETATPEQILILLYDGAIQYLNKSKIALEESNDEQFHTSILGCQKIIMEFMNTLDMELGGALAQNLYALYEYLYNCLVTAGINKNIKKIDEVLRHLTSLRETWQKAIEIANAEKNAKLLDSTESPKELKSEAYEQDRYIAAEQDEEEYDEEYEEDNDLEEDETDEVQE